MLSSISCTGFRSLEDVSIPLGPMTTFVGPNGAGKTAFLRAIDLVLGQGWPGLNRLRIPQDFTRFDPTHGLAVEIGFDPPLSSTDAMQESRPIHYLRLSCNPYKRTTRWGDAGDLHATFEPLAADHSVPTVATTPARKGSPPVFRPLTVSTGLRDQARVLFIDHRRSLLQHLPSARGSVLGRLFEPARKVFAADELMKQTFKDRYELTMEALRSPEIIRVEETIRDTALRMIGFLGSSATREVDIRFGFANPANPFSSFRLEVTDGALQLPGEEIGLGLQSAIVVGIFEALRQIEGEAGTVVIEEPEMYLHPQAQRYFHRLLCDLAESGECQVIYATHSPIFADIGRFEGIRLCRKPVGSMTGVSYVSEEAEIAYLSTQREAQKIKVAFDTARSELLFARKALLVEGPGDHLGALHVANRLELDPDAEGVAVVSCGGKAAIPFFARACTALKIPFIVMHDEDIYPVPVDGDEEQRRRVELDNGRAISENEAIADATDDALAIFTLQPSLEASLGIGRNAKDKPRRVLEHLEQTDLKQIPSPLRDAVQALFME